MLPAPHIWRTANEPVSFNGHPPLGVNATRRFTQRRARRLVHTSFNGHPPLGVNATLVNQILSTHNVRSFNGHPPLGVNATVANWQGSFGVTSRFNGHPPLGVNATLVYEHSLGFPTLFRFNGHPPLGVNATLTLRGTEPLVPLVFQWAPTLGGECYSPCYAQLPVWQRVSMGTHPWG